MEFVEIYDNDPDIIILKQIVMEPTILKRMCLSDNYFEWILSDEHEYIHKIIIDGSIIGFVQTELVDNKAYLGIAIKTSEQNKGYGKKTIGFILNWLPKIITEVEADIEVDNVFSIKLFESCGFIQTNKENDMYIYSKSI